MVPGGVKDAEPPVLVGGNEEVAALRELPDVRLSLAGLNLADLVHRGVRHRRHMPPLRVAPAAASCSSAAPVRASRRTRPGSEARDAKGEGQRVRGTSCCHGRGCCETCNMGVTSTSSHEVSAGNRCILCCSGEV